MIELEAEVGPIKYIAALVVDWGVTTDVDLNEAVRWVILIIICVFDPLAVALLIAANQSLMRRFPVEPPPPPQEIVDLEKPEPYEPPVETKPGAVSMVVKEQTEKIQSDWNSKLQAFNKKLPKPDEKPVEFIQEEHETIPHVDLKSKKKTEDEEIIAYKEKEAKEEEIDRKIRAEEDGFDEDQVKYDLETPTKAEQLEEFKKREEEERQALEDYAQKAREEDEPTIS